MNDIVFRLIFLLGGLALIGVAVGMATRGAIRLVVIGTLVLLSVLAIRLAYGQLSQQSPQVGSQPSPFPSFSIPPTSSLSPSPSTPTPLNQEGRTGMQELPAFTQPLTTATDGSKSNTSGQSNASEGRNPGRNQAGGSSATRPTPKRPILGGW